MTREQYLEYIESAPCLLDSVYENKKSTSGDWLNNFSLCNNYIKKFLYYRFNADDGMDIDSCEYIIPIYITLYDKVFEKYSLEKKVKNGSQFEILVNNPVYPLLYVRGDTAINAMSAIRQLFEFISNKKICKPNINNYKNNELRQEYKKYVEILESDERYTKTLELLDEHIKLCYSIGNFYPLTHVYGKYSLNSMKRQYSLNGYISVFDDVMSGWLTEMQNCVEGTSFYIREGYRRNLDTTYSFWINEFTSKDGWNTFIEYNCFEAFIKNDIPMVFWNVSRESFLLDFDSYLLNINNALRKRQDCIIHKLLKNSFDRCENLFPLMCE